MTAHVALIDVPFDDGEPRPLRVRRQSEYARMALRECAFRAGAPSSGWTQVDGGRPLPNDGWHWSLSHSRGMAAAAVARFPIGIDIEYVRPRREDLFDEIGAPQEWDLLGSRTWPAFFTLWTAKEATLKATGRGVGWLSQCRLLSHEPASAIVHLEGCNWPVWHFRRGEYVCAAAGSVEPVAWRVIPSRDLIESEPPPRVTWAAR